MKKFDCVVTDPPYGISLNQKSKKLGKTNKNNAICREWKPILGDDSTDTFKQNYEICKDICKNFVVWGGNYYPFLSPSRGWLVHDKKIYNKCYSKCELIYTSFDTRIDLLRYSWNGLIREGKYNIEYRHRLHPSHKPVGVIKYILEKYTKENETILDSFSGCGSTLIGCELTNRIFYGVEYDANYIEVILKRYKETFNKSVRRVNEDREFELNPLPLRDYIIQNPPTNIHLGDIFVLDNKHYLMCGDSTKEETFRELMKYL